MGIDKLAFKIFFNADKDFSDDFLEFASNDYPLIGAYLNLIKQIVKTKMDLLPESVINEDLINGLKIRTAKEVRKNFIESFGYPPEEVYQEMVRDKNHEIFKV